ncbi:hypothetical protein [Polynucleobacter sp. AP-Reno-20A-A9]|uniref:pPIWI-associating nuclease domain-containing protein n=1 Tax=Polynucleobacter sp. AP-Reno-20A-A9 TaxID=2576925 RepID=UPI001C0E4652|nr:hypothetical protein [Polynucleobacter sp. AP-Reno-20A-A9]MBU3627996.1 hypothetical protein [Polynucleobacter sp. AP-Reno-20A-A9]
MTAQLCKLLKGDFEERLYEAAYKNLRDFSNPLRFNNFSYALRELIRHLNMRLAPDQNVLKSSWYANVTGKKCGISRGQRAYYIVQGGISDEYIQNVLGIQTISMHRRLIKAIDELSKFTHIQPETFSIDCDRVNDLVLEIEGAINGWCTAIAECRYELIESVIEKVDMILINQTISETIESIDRLAPHHSIDELYVDGVEIVSIDHERLIFQATGIITAELQWGSNSNVRKGDGILMFDEFSFKCQLFSDVASPVSLTLMDDTFVVDTSAWNDYDDSF